MGAHANLFLFLDTDSNALFQIRNGCNSRYVLRVFLCLAPVYRRQLVISICYSMSVKKNVKLDA